MLQLEENFKSSTNLASLPPGNTDQEEGLGDTASKQYHIIIHNIAATFWKIPQKHLIYARLKRHSSNIFYRSQSDYNYTLA